MKDVGFFFTTLFDYGETTCIAESKYDTAVCNAHFRRPKHVFFSINPLHTSRRDAFVTVFRNVLVEFDQGTIEEQKKIIEESKIPYTSLTFSGKKSLHLIISLREPCKDADEYRALVKRIYDKMGGKEVVDTSTSNPSRFSRIPGAIRDNGVEQSLIALGDRVHRAVLNEWLGPEPTIAPKVRETLPKGILTDRTKYFLARGAEAGSWNVSLFKAACDMTRNGYELSDIIEDCSTITGKLDSRDIATIRSAHRSAKNDT